MTDVICYHAPYLFNGKDRLILSFVLNDDMSLHSILSLPTLLAMGATIDLQRGTSACSEFQHIFVLQLDSLGEGLPYGISLGESKSFILSGVHSRIFPPYLSSILLLWMVSIPLFHKRPLLIIL